jgi:hypothetical protein
MDTPSWWEPEGCSLGVVGHRVMIDHTTCPIGLKKRLDVNGLARTWVSGVIRVLESTGVEFGDVRHRTNLMKIVKCHTCRDSEINGGVVLLAVCEKYSFTPANRIAVMTLCKQLEADLRLTNQERK